VELCTGLPSEGSLCKGSCTWASLIPGPCGLATWRPGRRTPFAAGSEIWVSGECSPAPYHGGDRRAYAGASLPTSHTTCSTPSSLVLLQHLMAVHSSRSRGKSRYAHPRVHQNAVHASWTSRCRLASLDADRTALQDAWRLAPPISVHLSSPAPST
jgi:hypothetical protein